MIFSNYIKRAGKFIIKGVPEKKVYVTVDNVSLGETLRGKNIIITGGGSGIGKAIAYKCQSEGANVLILGRNETKLENVCKNHERLSYFVCDITKIEDLDKLVYYLTSNYTAGIDILINNAGVYKNINIKNTTEESYDEIFNTDMRATYFVTQKILPLINEGGEILVIASDTAYIGSTNPYHLAKAAVEAFARGLAKELVNERIRVNAIAPGPTLSEINTTDPRNGLQRTDKFRVLLAEEVANIAWFLLSDMATCINGQTICCDEGDRLR